MPREIVLSHDAPWEGAGSGYHRVFQDGDRYRFYYKSWMVQFKDGKYTETNPLYTAYAESNDGIHWRKSELGLHDFKESKANNIVMVGATMGGMEVDGRRPAVFRDDNPAAAPDARSKALLRAQPTNHRSPVPTGGGMAFKSPDGLHWMPLSDRPVSWRSAPISRTSRARSCNSGSCSETPTCTRISFSRSGASSREAAKVRSLRLIFAASRDIWIDCPRQRGGCALTHPAQTRRLKPKSRSPNRSTAPATPCCRPRAGRPVSRASAAN